MPASANSLLAADERLEWLARLVPDPSLPVPEASAAEVTGNGRSVVDALEVLVEAGRVEDASWAVARLRPYWLIGGNVVRGRDWTERVLALPQQGSPAARARLLEVAATLAFEQGDDGTARALFRQGKEAAREAGGDLDLAGGNPEQRLAVDDEPRHAAGRYTLERRGSSCRFRNDRVGGTRHCANQMTLSAAPLDIG
jgi:hypothetical protein